MSHHRPCANDAVITYRHSGKNQHGVSNEAPAPNGNASQFCISDDELATSIVRDHSHVRRKHAVISDLDQEAMIRVQEHSVLKRNVSAHRQPSRKQSLEVASEPIPSEM